jgi:hypothetical protein
MLTCHYNAGGEIKPRCGITWRNILKKAAKLNVKTIKEAVLACFYNTIQTANLYKSA